MAAHHNSEDAIAAPVNVMHPRIRRSLSTASSAISGASHVTRRLSRLSYAIVEDLGPQSLMLDRMTLMQSERQSEGKRAGLVKVLFGGALVMIGAVELFVRFVLDPIFEPKGAPPAASAPRYAGGSQAFQTPSRPQWSFTGSGITGDLSDLQFANYQCLLTWLTCVVTGLGSEFFVGYELLTSARRITRWHEHAWFVAQFLFSALIMSSLLLARAGNPLSLGFGILGMWKFGFPETLLCFLGGLHCKERHWTARLAGYLNGLGTLAHHSSALLLMCCLTLGLSPAARPVFACSLPLVLQHVVVSVRYYSVPLYGLLELLLEVFWEWEVFANVELFYLPHGVLLSPNPKYPDLNVRVVCGMLLAHWLYWLAAVVGGAGGALFPQQRALTHKHTSQSQEVGQRGSEREGRGGGIWQGSEVAEWRDQLVAYDGGAPRAHARQDVVAIDRAMAV